MKFCWQCLDDSHVKHDSNISNTNNLLTVLLFTYHIRLFQEWQNSIQKNAGLAFIELINEGRWRLLYSNNQYFSLFLGFYSTKMCILYSFEKPVVWLKIRSKPLVGCDVDITVNNIVAIICNISVWLSSCFIYSCLYKVSVILWVWSDSWLFFSRRRSAAQPTGPSANPSGQPFSLATA